MTKTTLYAKVGQSARMALCALVLLLSGAQAQELSYTFTSFDFPGGTDTAVNAVNDHGRMVGQYSDAGGKQHGFIRQGTQVKTLDFPGATRTFAWGVNNAGRVVGYYDAGGAEHGFLFHSGQFTQIDYPGATLTDANGINDAGDIVGEYTDSADVLHGFSLIAGTFTPLDFPGSTTTEAVGINNLGEIVGIYYDTAAVEHGFRWKNNRFKTLDLGSGGTAALKVTDDGTVCGLYIDSAVHGFVFRSGQLTTIDFPGATDTRTRGINATRMIVGRYTDSAGAMHGYFATPQ
jgi:probable HAF family extracellular repeat protein